MEELLTRLAALEISLEAKGAELNIYDPHHRLTEDLLLRIRESKLQLLTLLQDITEDHGQSDNIPQAEPKEHYRLSYTQARLYFLYTLDSASLAYNMPRVLKLSGPVNVNRLQEAFKQLVHRHESFRTSFMMTDEGPVQMVSAEVSFEIEHFLSASEEVREIIRRFTRPFDLARAPLIRVGLIAVSPTTHFLITDMHHIIADGVSESILIDEFAALYEGRNLPETTLKFKDYAEWQHSDGQHDKRQQDKTFWLNEFANGTPAFDLPADLVRSPGLQRKGKSVSFTIGNHETGKLKAIAASEGVTMFMLMLALYNVLLSRLSGQEEIVVGTPTAGREHADLENIIGSFINTLPLKNQPKGDHTFREFLSTVRLKTLACFDHQSYPYEALIADLVVERELSRNPLFDVMLNFMNFEQPAIHIPGLTVTPYPGTHDTVKFDLTLFAREANEDIFLELEYAADLFHESTIERFTGYLKQMVSVIIANPDILIRDLRIMPEEQAHRILHAFNDTRTDYPGDATLVSLFEEQVLRTPHKTAVTYEGKALTYNALNQRSNQLADYLRRACGIKPDAVVGVMLERSEKMIIALLGILKAGAAYLPIDPLYPKERVAYILEDSEAEILLADHEPQENTWYRGKVIYIDSICNDNIQNPQRVNSSRDLCYLIYTSGSTGRPKGVMISHYNVVNFLTGITQRIVIHADDRMLAITSISFDISVLEIFWTLCQGAEIVLHPSHVPFNLDRYIPAGKSEITDKSITMLQSTPSHIRLILESGESAGLLRSLRSLLLGGEALPPALLGELVKHTDATIYNMYGPTETTVWSCIHRFDEHTESISIGKPIANTQIYILDKALKLAPIGIPGGLFIGGHGLSRGYWKQPALTSERFIVNPFNQNERIYRTGDLGRWLEDGRIELLGREDHQVKIRGHRIEPGEIENLLLQHHQITEAVVLDRGDHEHKFLAAYYVSGETLNGDELKRYLSAKLPDYMVPSCYVWIAKMPMTPNGKIDRKALPEPEIKYDDNYGAPLGETEEVLAGIWSEILKIDKPLIGANADFFKLGGHSLNAIVMMSRVEKKFKRNIPLKLFYRIATIRELAKYISAFSCETEYAGNQEQFTF